MLDKCITPRMASMCLPLLEQCAVFPVCQVSFSFIMPHYFCDHSLGPAPPTCMIFPTVDVIRAVRVAVLLYGLTCCTSAGVSAHTVVADERIFVLYEGLVFIKVREP